MSLTSEQINKVLAIETSCDDTSVAVVDATGFVHLLKSASQDLAHRPFGGVVPEIAGRCHSETLVPLIQQTVEYLPGGWKDITGLVVTSQPGLLGSLLVGVVTAKSLALCYELPFLGVNHLEGHIFAPFVRDSDYQPPTPEFPFLSLAVSGGHTTLYRVEALGQYKVLGQTRDDAAGEAFDKFAKMLGLPFPGGVHVDRLAQQVAQQEGSNRFVFPKAMMEEGNIDFSFSGLKSHAQRTICALGVEEKRANIHELCRSFQNTVAEMLVEKLDRAARREGISHITITGGVSANSRLRALAQEWATNRGHSLIIPPLRFCTDNAAMIGFVGAMRMQRGERSNQKLAPSPVGAFS